MGTREERAVWADERTGSDCDGRRVNECTVVVDEDCFSESVRE